MQRYCFEHFREIALLRRPNVALFLFILSDLGNTGLNVLLAQLARKALSWIQGLYSANFTLGWGIRVVPIR